MGITRLKGFVKMFEAIAKKDFIEAGNELLNSRYARELPARAKRNYDLLVKV
jgi:hypothetical protein